MADAKKCDRCGTFYEVYGLKKGDPEFNTVEEVLLFPRSNNGKYKRYELCPVCARYLHAVLTTPPDQPPEQ